MARTARRRPAPPRRLTRPAIDALEARIAPAGNLLVVTDGANNAQVLREFTPGGVKLRELTIDTAGTARDLAVSDDGNIHDLFGDIGTVLRTYNSAGGTWSTHAIAGMSTVNNVSYGGAAYLDGAVFVTDMLTAGDTATQQGIVRFNLADWSAQRFASNLSPIDASAGLDGKLYALSSGGLVSVFDPASNAQTGSLTLPNAATQDYRAIAADAAGNLYAATWGSQLVKFDPNGNVLATLNLNNRGYTTHGLADVDVAADGTVIASSWGGSVFETTTALAGLAGAFSVGGTGHTFVTFAGAASSPPPSTPRVSVGDAAALEGNAGTTAMSFPVTLSNVSTGAVTVSYSTADGTARVADNDYQAASGTVTFNPGETRKVVTIPLIGDTIDEPNESFTLNLSTPVNATIGRGTALGTIADDDPAPTARPLAAGASGVLRDYTNSGTFTSQSSGAGGLSVRRFDYTGGNPSIPYDERSVLEFNIQSIPAQDVTGATLQLTTTSTTIPQTTNVDVYGFADDGNVTLDDGSRPAVLLGSFVPTSLTTYAVPLDLAGILSLVNAGATNIAIRLQGIPNDNVQFAGTSSPSAPKLTFQVSVTPPSVAVSDLTVNEGDVAGFTVTLSQPLTTTATFTYTTAPGGTPPYASANVDYVPVKGTVTFAPGETSKTVGVQTIGDPASDSGETFNLVLTGGPSGVAYSRGGAGTATVVDVPNPTPGVTVTGGSVAEGAPGATTPLTFTVALTVASPNPVSVTYATANGSATAGSDYQAAAGTLTFAPGETSKTVAVNVLGDNVYEGNESFTLTLGSPSGAVLVTPTATGTIVEDDPMPTVSIADASVTEGDSGSTNAQFVVTLSGPSAFTTYAGWATKDGTATAGADYQSWSNTLILNPGQTTGVINVPVYGDTFTEGNETFTVSLGNVSFTTVGRGTATGTVVDDDPTRGTMSFEAKSWGYAQDAGADGSFETFSRGGSSTFIVKTTTSPAVEDRSVYEFDVSRVVAGVVSSVTFDLDVSSYSSNVGVVNVGGFAGTGTAGLADATRSVVPLGSYPPNALGRVTVTLDRAAVLSLVGQSNYLGLRLDPGASYVNTDIHGPIAGPAFAPGVTFHADLPVAFADAYATLEDAPLTVAGSGVLANDYGPTGTTLSAVVDQAPAHGALTLNADGSFTYTPDANFSGTDTFAYHAFDGTNASNAASVTLTVDHVNHPPVASSSSVTANENAAAAVTLVASDPDNDPLTYTIVAAPAHGTLSGTAPNLIYTPAPNYNGPDSFSFQAGDGSLTSNVATVSITVNHVNHPPTAGDDAFTTNENTPLTVTAPGVLGNDNDPDGDRLRAVLVAGPAHGTLTLNADGSFTFSPDTNYDGRDSFTYKPTDGVLAGNVATVSLTVRHVNQPPVAVNDAYQVAKGTRLTVPAPGVIGNDTDPDGNVLTAVLVKGVSFGSLTFKANGSFVYQPKKNFTGTDQFTYKVSDGALSSNVATVTLTVTAGRISAMSSASGRPAAATATDAALSALAGRAAPRPTAAWVKAGGVDRRSIVPDVSLLEDIASAGRVGKRARRVRA